MKLLQRMLILFALGLSLCECSEDIPFLLEDSSLYDAGRDVLDFIKDKCEQKGQTNIVHDLQTESRKSMNCIRKYVNSSIVQDDFGKALRAKDMDGFFMKYCEVWPHVHACFESTINVIKTCLNDTEKQQVDDSLDVMDSMQMFMCADNASEMTNFYMEGGVEKFNDNWIGIKRCINSKGHKTIIFDSDRCDYVEWFRVCTNEGMNRSENSNAPAETMNEMFVTIREQYCPTNASNKLADSIPLIGLIILSLLRFTNTMESYMIQA